MSEAPYRTPGDPGPAAPDPALPVPHYTGPMYNPYPDRVKEVVAGPHLASGHVNALRAQDWLLVASWWVSRDAVGLRFVRAVGLRFVRATVLPHGHPLRVDDALCSFEAHAAQRGLNNATESERC